MDEPTDRGEGMLSRLSNEMVRSQKEFFGKGPTSAKSYLLDDMLFIVMRGGLTTAEKTMLQFGHPGLVRQFRQLFENEMTGRLTSMVEEITGRKVVNYQSQVMFDPDVVIEMFVFDSRAPEEGRSATAGGVARADGTGEAISEDILGPSARPASGGAGPDA